MKWEKEIRKAAFDLVPARWALAGKDIPVRGNPNEVMIILVFKSKHG